MLRGAHQENGPPGTLHTHTHTRRGSAWNRARGWRPESSRGRNQIQTEGPMQKQRRGEQERRVGGRWVGGEGWWVGVLAGLPVPPKSWDYLLLQSTVAQQKQREQQNYTHHPAQQPLPHLQLHVAEGRACARPTEASGSSSARV